MSTVAPHNPFWVFFVRIAQAVLALVLLAVAAAIGGGGDLADAPALVVASAVFTWIVVAYAIVTDKISALNKLYHIFAIIALDAFLAIMWLCAWALSAARAAQYQAAIDSYNDSCGIFGCYVKRELQKRYLTVGTVKGLLGACAGLGALIWLLIIATLVLNVLGLLRGANKTSVSDSHQTEEAKTQPNAAVQPQAAPQGQYIQPQYTGQQPAEQIQPQYTGQEQPQYIQPQYTGQEQQQPIQPQYTGPQQPHETYIQQAQPAPGEVQYPPVAPPAPHN